MLLRRAIALPQHLDMLELAAFNFDVSMLQK